MWLLINKQKTADLLIDLSLLLVTLSPFIYLGNYFYNARSTPRIIFYAAGVVCALLGYFFSSEKIRAQIQERFSHPLVVALLLYVGWLVVRWALSPNELGWWGTWGRNNGIWLYLSWTMLLPIFAQRFSARSELKKFFLWLFILLAAGAALLTPLFSNLFTNGFFENARWNGLVGNALYFSSIVLFVPWAIAAVVPTSIGNRRRNIFIGAAVLITALLVYCSGTRGAELAFVCAALVFIFDLFWAKIKTRIKKIFLLIGCGLIVLGVGWLLARSATIYLQKVDFHNFEYRLSTIQDRLIVWQLASADIKNHPLVGFGPGNLWATVSRHSGAVARNNQNDFFDSSHSAVLDILIESGFIGLALFLWWLTRIWFSVSAGDQITRALGRASVVAYVIAAATSFLHPWSMVPMLLIVATNLNNPIRKEINLSLGAHNIFLTTTKVLLLRYGIPIVAMVVGGAALIIMTTVPAQGWRIHAVQQALSRGGGLSDVVKNNKVFGWFPYNLDRDLYLGVLLAARLDDDALAPPASVTIEFVKNVLPHFDRYVREIDWPGELDFAMAFLYRALAPQAGADRTGLLAVADQLTQRALNKDNNNPKFIIERAAFLEANNQTDDAVALLRVYRNKNLFVRYIYFYEMQLLQSHARALEAAETARALIKTLQQLQNDIDLEPTQDYLAALEQNHFVGLTSARKQLFEFWFK